MAILLKTASVRVSSIQIMQVRVQNKCKSVWKSRYVWDISITTVTVIIIIIIISSVTSKAIVDPLVSHLNHSSMHAITAAIMFVVLVCE